MLIPGPGSRPGFLAIFLHPHGLSPGDMGIAHDRFVEIPVPEVMGDHQLTTADPFENFIDSRIIQCVHNDERNQSFLSPVCATFPRFTRPRV